MQMKQNEGKRLFSIAGVEVRATAAFFVLILLLGMSAGPFERTIVWVGTVTFSILWHEMGHVLAFKSFGAKRAVITLWGFGGLASAPGGPPLDWWRRFLVAAAGPAAGLLLGLFVAGTTSSDPYAALFPGSSIGTVIVTDLLYVNVFWSLANLVPLLPLDGGRMADAILTRVLGSKGRTVTRVVSVATAAAAVFYGLQIGSTWIALLAGFFGLENISELAGKRGGVASSEDKRSAVAGVESALLAKDLKLALKLSRNLVQQRDEHSRHLGRMLLMWSLLAGGDEATAAEIAGPGAEIVVTPVLGSTAVAAFGDEEEALQALRTAYLQHPNPGMASHYVVALIERGRLDEALLVVDHLEESVSFYASGRTMVALIEAERHEEALSLGKKLFEKRPHAVIAYNMACAHARLSDLESALQWLERSVDLGMNDAAGMQGDADLTILHRSERFQALVARMKEAQIH